MNQIHKTYCSCLEAGMLCDRARRLLDYASDLCANALLAMDDELAKWEAYDKAFERYEAHIKGEEY